MIMMHTMHRGRPQRAQPPALRNLRHEKLSLTTTLTTKLLTNPLAQSRSTEHARYQSPAADRDPAARLAASGNPAWVVHAEKGDVASPRPSAPHSRPLPT